MEFPIMYGFAVIAVIFWLLAWFLMPSNDDIFDHDMKHIFGIYGILWLGVLMMFFQIVIWTVALIKNVWASL